jgi:hypothetical protein
MVHFRLATSVAKSYTSLVELDAVANHICLRRHLEVASLDLRHDRSSDFPALSALQLLYQINLVHFQEYSTSSPVLSHLHPNYMHLFASAAIEPLASPGKHG